MTPLGGIDGLPVQEEFDRQYQRRARSQVAYVGRRDGTITGTRSYYIYVRDFSVNGPEYQVYDPGRNAPRIPGVPVTIVEDEFVPGRYMVKSVASFAPPAVIESQSGPMALQYGGADMLIVDQRQIKQGRIHQTETPGMTVTLEGFTVLEGGTVHTVSTQDTSTITAPSAGNARWDVVSVDPFDWTVTVTSGVAFDKNYPSAGVKPDCPTSEIFVGYVRSNDSTTDLRDIRNIDPDQPYFTIPGQFQHAISAAANTSGPGLYRVDTTGGAVTLTLDTDDVVAGREITIKDTGNGGTNNVTIATEGAETIDGAATQTISANYGYMRLCSDGTNWDIIG